MKKTIKQLNSIQLQQEYPLMGLVRDWFFRCEEISSGEGIDIWGRTLSATGMDPERLFEQCVTNDKSINTSFEKAEKKLEPEENELRGNWIVEDGVVTADETCRRIEWLTANWLEKQAVDETGWNVLYRDPIDGRYWELTYPLSEMHGGGPPALFHVSKEAVESRYGKCGDT